MAAKKIKRKAGPDKTRLAAKRRAERNSLYPADFEMSLPDDVADETLAQIMPMPPKWTIDTGRLTASPAKTWLNLGDTSDEAGELIARWPFRIAPPGERPGGPWLCLAQLAYEQGIDVTEAALAQCELEDGGWLAWDGGHNFYAMTGPQRLEDLGLDPDAAPGSARDRAQRRWLGLGAGTTADPGEA